MTFIPNKPIHFRVTAGGAGTLLVEACGGDYERQELALGFEALATALRHFDFIVQDRMDGDSAPRLPIAFPTRRQWLWVDRSLSLDQADAGGVGDQFVLLPEAARSWRLQWINNGQTIETVGDAPSPPRDDFWSRLSIAQVDFQSPRLVQDSDGRLLLTGRLRAVNAPPLNRAFEAQVSCGGVGVTGYVNADGHLNAHLQPLPARPALMRFTISLPALIAKTLLQIDTGDIVIRTAFQGATVAVDDTTLAQFGTTIPAGHVPVAIRFASSTYRPEETALTLVAQKGGRAYHFRMKEAGQEKYRLIETDSKIERLLEARLEVRLEESQEEPAGLLEVIPQTLVGHWAPAADGFEWQPGRELPEFGIANPRSDDRTRPQRIDYRGTRIAIDPTAFDGLIAKDPLTVLSGNVVAFTGTSGRPRSKEYACISAQQQVVGTLRQAARGKFEVPSALSSTLEEKTAVIIQSDDASEQGLLWIPENLGGDISSYRPVPMDEIESAEGRPALVVFRGIYLPVTVLKLRSSGGSDPWIIELTTPLPFPQHVQIEPFLPVMMHVDPPSRVALWQFGESDETSLSIRGDGILAGAGVGYVFRPRAVEAVSAAASETTYDWVAFPPSTDDAEVVYCSWRGFLFRFDARLGEIRFGGWFLPNGEATYPRRAPFDSYRFARRRESAAGLLAGSWDGETADWKWLLSTIPDEDLPTILERVRGFYPDIPKGEADLVYLEALERDVQAATRRYILQPVWSTSQKSLQIKVTEQSQEPLTKSCEAVHLLAERRR